MYTLYNHITKTTVGTYKTFRAACKAKDRKDLQYVACRYQVKEIK